MNIDSLRPLTLKMPAARGLLLTLHPGGVEKHHKADWTTLNGPRCANGKKSISIGNCAQLDKICPFVRTESGNAFMLSDRLAEKMKCDKCPRNTTQETTEPTATQTSPIWQASWFVCAPSSGSFIALPNTHSLLPRRRCLSKMHAKKKNVKRGHSTTSCVKAQLSARLATKIDVKHRQGIRLAGSPAQLHHAGAARRNERNQGPAP